MACTPPENSEHNFGLVWPLLQDGYPELEDSEPAPQSPTALTSRRVHCGESQDAPVVGTERVRRAP